MTSTEHIAHRPSWDCLACGKPWPCDPAREALAAEMDLVQLAIYAWGCLEEASANLPGMPVAEAFDRFIAWTRRAPALTCLGTIAGFEASCGSGEPHTEH